MPSKAEFAAWQAKLADLKKRHQSFIDAGMEDTGWSKEIAELESKIAGGLEDLDDGK